MDCPICFSVNCRTCFELYDDRYGYPGSLILAQCPDCGHKFLQGEFSPDLLKKLYTEYYPRSTFKIDSYKPHPEIHGFKAWLNGSYCSAFRWVPKNVRILDIGCGFGESLGYHKSRGCDIYGVEADENVRSIAKKFDYKIHIGLFDPSLYKPEFFDYVTMDQVIEHMADPIKTLKDIAQVLKPNGMAIISTPNSNGLRARILGRYWINWHAPYHLQHFSVKSIKIAAEKTGFTLEKYRTITNSEWLYFQWNHLIAFPEMGEPSVFWSPYAIRSLFNKITVRMLQLVHRTKLNHAVTRFFDALDAGDNYLFFLRKHK